MRQRENYGFWAWKRWLRPVEGRCSKMNDRERGLDFGLGEMGVMMRQIAVVLAIVFVIALAVVVGKRMSAEAMAVVVGVVCGVAAGIPTSILLLVVFTRRDRQRAEEMQQRGRRQDYPPVVVIQGGSQQTLPMGPQAGYWPAPVPGPTTNRQFHVVGGDDLLLDDGQY
jgi:hypothetical protein